jgi:hypothetical protein
MDRIKQGNSRTEELNNRMAQRNIPSGALQPQFDIRPVSTKYATMPMADQRAFATVPIQKQPIYSIANTFNPGSAQAPWGGFAENINDESRLRNQFFALQRGAGQACYIPAKSSDMYVANVPRTAEQVIQPFPDLFNKPQFDPFNPCLQNTGDNFFENCTRQQTKEVK